MSRSSLGLLSACEACPRACGANRLAGETGYCGIAAQARVSHAGLHFGEEPPLSGRRGSGTIFFAGCNLRCVFCQNHQISQEFRAAPTRSLGADELARAMLRLQDEGAHNINFVSPSHVVYQAAEAVRSARARGLTVPIVYNSNGYDSPDSLRRIRGLVDIYLPDLKYMDDELARQLSDADDYSSVAIRALEEMLGQVGHLEVDGGGVATRGLLVRHLVLPGHTRNSRRCLRALADLDPKIAVSIMSQYSPRHRAARHPEINRALTPEEYEEVTSFALELGLENALVQDLESHRHHLPDFSSDRPFG